MIPGKFVLAISGGGVAFNWLFDNSRVQASCRRSQGCCSLTLRTEHVQGTRSGGGTRVTSSRLNSQTPIFSIDFMYMPQSARGGCRSSTRGDRCVYLAYTGGCAAIAVDHTDSVRTAETCSLRCRSGQGVGYRFSPDSPE